MYLAPPILRKATPTNWRRLKKPIRDISEAEFENNCASFWISRGPGGSRIIECKFWIWNSSVRLRSRWLSFIPWTVGRIFPSRGRHRDSSRFLSDSRDNGDELFWVECTSVTTKEIEVVAAPVIPRCRDDGEDLPVFFDVINWYF